MTIYSQHANRGKIQILATYNGDAGITSSTVTSVDDDKAAAAIVDALNRISASATMPVSIHDERPDRPSYYPSGHLAALTDPSYRDDLLTGKGEHGLWYEYAMLMLHRALGDLDTAMASMPAPVQTAITAELEAEACGLRVGLAIFGEGSSGEESDRQWDFGDPFVQYDGGIAELGSEMRERLDRLEEDLPESQHAQAAEDLRLLYSVYIPVAGNYATLEEEDLSLFFEPVDNPGDGYFLTIDAPRPGHPNGSPSWSVTISRWEADERDSEGEVTSAHGESVLDCALMSRPTAGELADLLSLAETGSEQMSAWAETPVGEALAGTVAVVTKRYDEAN
jgi:hypothetical protein